MFRSLHRSTWSAAAVPCFFLLALAVSCKHEPMEVPLEKDPGDGNGTWMPPPDTMTTGVTCDPDTVYFEQSVLPLMVSFCATSGCHDAVSHEEGVRLYDYAHIRHEVHPGDPGESDLIEAMFEDDDDDHMPPYDHPQLSPGQISAIITWIEQGALHNSCEPTACDTANVTYAGTIAPLFATMCNGCHGGSSPDGGIDLTTYSGAHAVATNGHLAGSLLQQTGYAVMPPVGAGLSQCHIDQVLQWIGQGAPNN